MVSAFPSTAQEIVKNMQPNRKKPPLVYSHIDFRYCTPVCRCVGGAKRKPGPREGKIALFIQNQANNQETMQKSPLDKPCVLD
jgi:hypothetical protein